MARIRRRFPSLNLPFALNDSAAVSIASICVASKGKVGDSCPRGDFTSPDGSDAIHPDCWQKRKNARTYSSRFRAELAE
jgi:hypothetical protein